MAAPAKESRSPRPESTWLEDAREMLRIQGQSVLALAQRLNGSFTQAVDAILHCQGRVVVTGMGKSGIVAQKISATLASTGTPSLFLHAADASHGDLGRIIGDDVVLALSNSGESEEVLRIVRPVKAMGATLISLTGVESSSLAKHADVAIAIGDVSEACPMGLVPTVSTTAMMVVGDALALALFQARGFGPAEYARFHPGGQLGRKLMRIEEVMRTGAESPTAPTTATIRDVIRVMTETPGRPGAASIVESDGTLVGFFTDGDLRRLLEKSDFDVATPIVDVMASKPRSVRQTQLIVEAARILREHKIDQVPVVDDANRLVGYFDIQDFLSTRTF